MLSIYSDKGNSYRYKKYMKMKMVIVQWMNERIYNNNLDAKEAH